MPNPLVAVAGIGGASSVIGANKAGQAAEGAAAAQTEASQTAIEEQQRQFDKITELMAPFVSGGTDAFSEMAKLAGVSGADAQGEAIQAIKDGPQFQTAMDLGEEAILSNASATGGLRGGNTEAALASLGPQILSSAINQKYGQLGGLASVGQASAGQQAASGQAFAGNVGQLLQSQGAATAGGLLGRANAFNAGLGGVNQAIGFGSSFIQPPKDAGIFDKWGF